jgi:glucose/arabinose dehydrogenase
LRIEVDHESGDKAYSVPLNNPFINTPRARPEVWAYGFRNPWRMSVDMKTGDLWTADVGWELWEMVYRVERGGNYGWSIMEGSRQQIKPGGKRGPSPILPPTFEHPHSNRRPSRVVPFIGQTPA